MSETTISVITLILHLIYTYLQIALQIQNKVAYSKQKQLILFADV